MLQVITYNDAPINVQTFIRTWKRLKHYPQTDLLTIGELLELLISTSRSLHREEIASGVFNWLLTDEGVIFGYDGSEPIEIYYYLAIKSIKKYIARV